MSSSLYFLSTLERKRKGAPLDACCKKLSCEEALALLQHANDDGDIPYCEYLRGDEINDGKSKFYLDSDQYYNTKPSDEEICKRTAQMRQKVEEIMDRITYNAPAHVKGTLSYRMATRHGFVSSPVCVREEMQQPKYKLSYRFYVLGVTVKRYWTIRKFLDHHLDLGIIGKDDKCIWDLSVYKQGDQPIAAINMIKGGGDERRLVPGIDEPCNASLLEYTVQWVDESWPITDFHDIDDQRSQEEVGDVGFPKTKWTDDAAIEDVLRLLKKHRWDEYASWRDIATALKNDFGESKYLNLFLKLSRTSPKFDEDQARKMWASVARGDFHGRKLTMATLEAWARADDPVGYATLKARVVSTPSVSGALPDEHIKSINTSAVLEALQRIGVTKEPSTDLRLTSDAGALSVVARDNGDRLCHIGPDLVVKTADDGRFAGTLYKDVNVDKSLSFVHDAIPSGALFVFNRDARQGKLRADAENIEVEWANIDEAVAVNALKVISHGNKSVTVRDKNKILSVRNLVDKAVEAFAHREFGITQNVFLTVNKNNVNIQNLTIIDPNKDAAATRADSELSCAWVAFQKSAVETDDIKTNEIGRWRIVQCGDAFYYFDADRGIWFKTKQMDHVVNHMTRAMEATGFMGTCLTEPERKYVRGIRGGTCVFRRMLNDVLDPHFERRLDANLDALLPFDNGVYELKTRTFRELRWDDYITTTIGYDFVPSGEVPAEHTLRVREFFERVLPIPEERELLLRMAGSALCGMPLNKKFLVLQDYRGGDNGKSMVVKAIEGAFGAFCMPNQPAFLCAATHVNPNGHEANTLAYKGKRLGIFDETDPKARFDLTKLKSLTGGAPRMAVRGANAATLTEFRWTAFIMIACNKSCLPQVDSTDTAFINRMVPVPMRAKFNDADAAAGLPHSYPKDIHMQEKLIEARMAVMHVLLEALARHVESGGTFDELPPGCLELRKAIAMDSDPLLEIVNSFVDEHVEFNLVRTDDMKGRKVLGYVKRDDLIDDIRQGKDKGAFRGVKAGTIKDLCDSIMAAKNRPLCAKATVCGEQVYNVYKGCALKRNMFMFEDE